MELSARNQLKGTVKQVKSGSVMAEVTVDVQQGRSPRRSPTPRPSAWA